MTAHSPAPTARPATTAGRAPVVEARGLLKSFGRARALDGLDLTVRAGEVAGFLGPNGAGKSTTIRVLLGLLRADGGTAHVLGGDPWHDAVALHRRLAYVPGDVDLWPTLTGGEVVDLLVRLRGHVDAQRRDELVARFDLDPTKKMRTYSKGNRQKVALVAAFASDVELYLLDEPTSGLDPLMETVFAECVREAAARGSAVLLSSHVLAEVEKLCDTVTIVRAGRTVEAGTLADLRRLTRSTVTTVTPGDAAALATLPGVHGFASDPHADGHRTTLDVEDTDLPGLLAALAALVPSHVTVAPPSLEELFLRHYGAEPGPGEQPDRQDAALEPRTRRSR
ncbi:ABC transporter ATP-binding protein [Sanguibacter sp. HDW7]|uniref:ABC transporter ATP-binding protein n=1 Tax=Sanguibacter sp. HDW7 TaxID=2714931 RepID=UPI00140C8ED8|nr:ABC transporter ATP-binding protein [Sanguibacter sp. HDW7]QIK83779.1 ABC transporter ATP-binding protein [Sanguibacter sp. HDW7]